MKEYFKKKLLEKLIISLNSYRIEFNDIILHEIDFGQYEIIRKEFFDESTNELVYKIIGLKKLNRRYKVRNGKYVMFVNGLERSLHSSQFIDFRKSDFRNEQINKILC